MLRNTPGHKAAPHLDRPVVRELLVVAGRAVVIRVPLDKLSIEAKVNISDQGRGAFEARIDELFVGAINAYKDGDLDLAIDLARELLELYPQHEHAKQIVAAAQRTRDVKEGMDRKQSEAAEVVGSDAEAGPGETETRRDEVFEN